jgi:hypothetical protein
VVVGQRRRPREHDDPPGRPLGCGHGGADARGRSEIEAGFDYLYVQASTDGGTTWTSLDGTTGGEPLARTASDQPAILHVNGRASLIRGQNAQPVFDETRPYWFPEIPQSGVKVPDTGTRIRVASVDGTSMRIRVSSS